MNLAENIAATYLRLNGFFLLPQFTIFTGGNQHNHLDILALRAKNCREIVRTQVGDHDLLVDKNLFDALGVGSMGKRVGLVVQVKSNEENIAPKQSQIDYVKGFFGDDDVDIFRVSFFHSKFKVRKSSDGIIEVGVVSAAHWIQSRIKRMEKMKGLRKKTKSWTWSEPFLADFLQLYDYGLLKSVR